MVIITAAIKPEAAIPVRLIIDETRNIIKKDGNALSTPISIPFLRTEPTALNPPKNPETALIKKINNL